MNLKQVILSDASTEAKVSAIAILLDKELPKLTEQVDTVKKLKGEQGDHGLKGDKGDTGQSGKDGVDGRNGIDGSTGKDGKDGEDGISVVDAKVDFDDTLVLTLSSGKEINVGEVKGEKGDNGRDGNTGANGIGVPTGGTSGQVLAKNSSADYDTHWITSSGGGGGVSSVASADGSVTVTTVSGAVDLSVAVAASTTNMVVLVRNTTGATLIKGTAVYISGATGQNPTVSKAIATGDATSAQTLGLMSADLANNSNGYVTVIGLISNLNTSAYSDGDQLYLSGVTAGTLTATKTYAPIHLVYVAVVEHAHPTQGKLFVKVQNGYEMDELHNVSAQSPSNGDILIYNTSTSLWEKNTPTSARTALSLAKSGANTDLTSVALTTGTINTAPSSSTDIVNKSYADSIASGVNFHAAVQYATTAALPANTYNNGSSGIGATLTATAVGTLTIDGYTLVVGDVGKRLLIKNEVATANNGVYTLTQAGTAILPYILTRATDYDSSGSGTNEVDQGDLILVINGTANANTSWVEQTPLPITIGTTSLVFIQFAAIQTYTAGTGLTLTTNQFSITNQGTAGTYGSASTVPVITTNAQGQVTAVTNTTIAISGGAVTGNISGSAGSVANTLTAGTGISFNSGTTYNGSAAITISSATVLAKSTSAFTTGTAATYTAPTNTQWVKVTVVGAGGNGGGAASQRATGGGGGGIAIKWLAMTAGQTLTYTVGTAAGSASTVSSGTLTITTITANSGANGTGTAYAASITAGAAGGTATNGDVNISGEQGGYSYGSGTTVTTNFSGKGGDCPAFGSGGQALAMVITAGVQGNGFGAGGGGAHGSATTAAGRGGIIIFEAF